MTTDTSIVLTLTGMTEKGDGIGEHQGRKIFVSGALPGETVRVQLHGIKPGYAQGELLQVLTPSAERVENFCRHSECGGCQLGIMNYPAQLRLKRERTMAALARYHLSPGVRECLGMVHPFAYRNKMLYAVQPSAEGLELGFYRKASHTLLPCDDCAVQPALCQQLVAMVRQWAREFGIEPYNEQQHSGQLRYLMLRDGRQSGEWMVVLVTLGEALPGIDVLLERLKSVPAVCSVVQNINPEPGNRILGFTNRVLQGQALIRDELDGLQFALSPLSFYQINPEQTRLLYGEALRQAELKGDEQVFDLYCGVGSISLYLARQARSVVGVEIVPEAIKDARENARLNGLTNTEFYVGKAEVVVPELYARGYKADVVVVDPPRKGCDRVLLDTLLKMAPERIVYVSCDPDSLARDLAFLELQGYQIGEVQPVDMFPHTLHVENVVTLCQA